MAKLKLIQPPARYRAELFNREVNEKLRTSRAFGSSWNKRVPVLVAAMKAKAEDPKTLIAYLPPPPKIARIVSPLLFRKPRVKKKGIIPTKAQPEALLHDEAVKPYLRLSNGQIVRLRLTLPLGALRADTPGGKVTLRPADLTQLKHEVFPVLTQ